MLDCIVIGSGFSGLVAARAIAKAKRSVLVLEARDRIGGRCLTYQDFPGPVDLGCSWIHGYTEGSSVRKLAEEYGLESYIPKPAPSLVISPDGIVPADVLAKISSNLGKAQREASSFEVTSSAQDKSLASALLASNSALFDGLNEKEKDLAEGLARTMQIGLGATLEQISLRWNGYEGKFDGTNAFIKGGYIKVIECLKAEIEANGGEIKFGEAVTGVEKTGNAVVVTSASGTTFEAKTVLSTIPLGVLKVLKPTFFTPPLSARKADAIANTNSGQLGKICLSYSAPWWDAALGGFTLLPKSDDKLATASKTTLDLLSSTSLASMSYAVPTLHNPHPTILIYLPVPIAQKIEALPLDEAAAAAHALLAARIPATSTVTTPIKAALTSWSTDQYSLGATSTPPVTTRSPVDFVELARPEWQNALLFGGEHTDVDHRGSVTGAVESGLREGDRIVRLLAIQD